MMTSRYSLGATSVPSLAALNSRGGQSRASLGIDGGEGFEHGAVMEQLDPMLRRLVAESKVFAFCGDARPRAEQSVEMRLRARQRWRLHARDRRHVFADRLVQPADKPLGVQLVRPIMPPGRQTRMSSLAALSWFGANITPKVESTTSKLASGKGRFAASAR